MGPFRSLSRLLMERACVAATGAPQVLCQSSINTWAVGQMPAVHSPSREILLVRAPGEAYLSCSARRALRMRDGPSLRSSGSTALARSGHSRAPSGISLGGAGQAHHASPFSPSIETVPDARRRGPNLREAEPTPGCSGTAGPFTVRLQPGLLWTLSHTGKTTG